MRWRRIAGVVLALVGGVWVLQGVGTLKGSFMTGDRRWMWIGIGSLVVGLLMLVGSSGRRRRR